MEDTCASQEKDLAAMELECQGVRRRLEGREDEVRKLQQELAETREHALVCQVRVGVVPCEGCQVVI